jgi:hypothetical protein
VQQHEEQLEQLAGVLQLPQKVSPHPHAAGQEEATAPRPSESNPPRLVILPLKVKDPRRTRFRARLLGHPEQMHTGFVGKSVARQSA